MKLRDADQMRDQDFEMSNSELGEWVVALLATIFIWPVGVVLLFRKLTKRTDPYGDGIGELVNGVERQKNSFTRRGNYAERRRQSRIAEARANYTVENELKKEISNAKIMIIGGGIAAAVFGLGGIATMAMNLGAGPMEALKSFYLDAGIGAAGAVFLYGGLFRTKKAKRFLNYLDIMEQEETLSAERIAEAAGEKLELVSEDLEEMLRRRLISLEEMEKAEG